MESPVNFSVEKEALVKKSWEILKPDVLQHGLKMFAAVGQKLPEARDMFYFLKDPNVIPQDNPKLKSHVVKVFTMVRLQAPTGPDPVFRCINNLQKVVAAGSTLRNLARVHLKKGVQDAHFEVVKVAFLKVIEEGVGELWNEEMRAAWAEAYDHLAAAIMAEMKVQTN